MLRDGSVRPRFSRCVRLRITQPRPDYPWIIGLHGTCKMGRRGSEKGPTLRLSAPGLLNRCSRMSRPPPRTPQRPATSTQTFMTTQTLTGQPSLLHFPESLHLVLRTLLIFPCTQTQHRTTRGTPRRHQTSSTAPSSPLGRPPMSGRCPTVPLAREPDRLSLPRLLLDSGPPFFSLHLGSGRQTRLRRTRARSLNHLATPHRICHSICISRPQTDRHPALELSRSSDDRFSI